ncbi:MotA/TolQ/ExbB proton channel family protein [bacterium]|nr:MotA/TolQ/ExbB proton channel family protein [bacterium]
MNQPINHIADSSFLNIIIQGGALSLAILAVLLFMSVLSWAVIGWKWASFKIATRSAISYLKNLSLENGLSDAQARSETFSMTYYAKEFQAAYNEFTDSHNKTRQSFYLGDKQDFLLRIERSIEKCIVGESLKFDSNLIILATISSSAPFIGLFGTVTGIIDAFYSIGSQGAASIAVVAPGISAALVATAFGLFAAIPALIAYNVFRNKTRIIRQQMEAFGYSLINLFDKEYSKSVNISKTLQQSKSN